MNIIVNELYLFMMCNHIAVKTTPDKRNVGKINCWIDFNDYDEYRVRFMCVASW